MDHSIAAQGTPESDPGSFECFQNYTAPEVFIQGLAGIIDQQDVESMIRAQKHMLQRFEKTNEMLTNCNQLSVNRLKSAGVEFKKHTALLIEMKKDLDYIFKKIRLVKNKLSQQYPQAFNEAVRSSLAEEVLVEDINQGPKPLEPEVVPFTVAPSSIAKDQDPDSDVPVEEFQFAKLRKRELKRNDSSSTDSNNDQSNADDSSCTSDTN
ncbi:kxDL motif-containing protein CG10681 isoform X2 [Chelonus insularis]|uniref:kxDL motif-containing protein CG10681 isoform X1 n=1 Tax=Chelonus insularis TaxID=460826 RepID=UPI00158972EE|nr:kxDL motif-containing protein CG10681 isoform X1 [Chelonus insularis]XP_034949701.1 kxDL motif-containing protein CG10681 isoform X2 [Chelonus insularis]